MQGSQDGGGWRGDGGDAVGPAEAAEVGDEVADPVEALGKGGGKGLPGVGRRRGGRFTHGCVAWSIRLAVRS